MELFPLPLLSSSVLATVGSYSDCFSFSSCPQLCKSISSFSDKLGNLTSSCNAACLCNAVQFAPVCGVDKISYFAPCHAGCHSKKNAQVSSGSVVKSPICCTDPFPALWPNLFVTELEVIQKSVTSTQSKTCCGSEISQFVVNN